MADFGDLGLKATELQLEHALANHQRQTARPAGDHPYCLDCDEPIPLKRREALSGVDTCFDCQSIRDAATQHVGRT